MKSTALIVFLMFFGLIASAQDSMKVKEVGLTLGDFHEFGVTARLGSNKALWRLASFSNYLSNSDYSNQDEDLIMNRAGFGLSVGREYRKPVGRYFEMRAGFDLSYQYRRYFFYYNELSATIVEDLDFSQTYEYGVNAMIGFNFVPNDHFKLGVELLPGVSYAQIKGEQWDNDGSVNINSKRWEAEVPDGPFVISLACTL